MGDVRFGRPMDLVEALPQGLNSEIGDFGSSLSAGQRQRLAIAGSCIKSRGY